MGREKKAVGVRWVDMAVTVAVVDEAGILKEMLIASVIAVVEEKLV